MMLKRIVMLIVLGLMFSSCQEIRDFGELMGIKDAKNRYEREREKKELSKKDAPGAIAVDEYKEEVKGVLQNIMKRPVNKKVQFEGTTLLIPENTRLNLKHGNIVDEKTGYGIALAIKRDNRGTSGVFYTKKIRNDLYIFLYYNNMDKDLDVIAKKIIKVNGFSKNCK